MQMHVHVLPFLTQGQLVVPDVLQAALPPLEVFLPQEQPLRLSSCKESEKSKKCFSIFYLFHKYDYTVL